MLTDLTRAFEQLNEPAIQRLLLLCAGGALALFAALTVLCWLALTALGPTGIGPIDLLISLAGVAAAVFLAWLLFPIVVALILSFFLETVAEAVERRYYPDLPPAQGWGVLEATWATLRFVAFALLLNLLVLPLYLLPGPNIAIYLALNGFLLGREYFILVAQRRADAAEVKRRWRAARAELFVVGVLIAAMLTVPVFNLVAPVVATALMVHRFERLCRRDAGHDAALTRPEAAHTAREPPDQTV